MTAFPSGSTVKGRPIVDGMAGVHARGHIRIAANVADAETVTIGDDVYEFDRTANGVVAGNIAVTGHADDTPANATDALIVAINTRDNMVKAVDLGVNDILIVAKSANVNETVMSETMGGAGNVVDGALYAGSDSTLVQVHATQVVVTANEVAAGEAVIPLTFTPTEAIVVVRDAAGALVAWNGAVTLDATNDFVRIDNGGVTNFSATDVLNVLVW